MMLIFNLCITSRLYLDRNVRNKKIGENNLTKTILLSAADSAIPLCHR